MIDPLTRGIRAMLGAPSQIKNQTVTGLSTAAAAAFETGETAAMKLSAVCRSVEILSDSMSKLPMDIIDRKTKEKVELPLLDILCARMNEYMSPATAKKLMMTNEINAGNGYGWIIRNRQTLEPEEILPLPHSFVVPFWEPKTASRWYSVINPVTMDMTNVPAMDMLHTMGYSRDGFTGIGVLERASEVIAAGRAAQEYNKQYYLRGGQPSGVLYTDTDLNGSKTITLPDGSTRTIGYKDLMRAEWDKIHSGPTNAHKIAILDMGLKYQPISISNRDAQFVEQAAISIEDIARFYGVPLYKLQAGKQSYSSNEQNAIEYVVGTLTPKITAWEQEWTYKLLPSKLAKRYAIKINEKAELRGDYSAQATWYQKMSDIGVYSVDDIRDLEDMTSVPGGSARKASLNYVPLEDWPELSKRRNGGNN